MSSSKDTQEEISNSLNSHPKSRKANTPPIDSCLPNWPPQTKQDISKAPTECEDELHSSGMASALFLSPPTSPPPNEADLTPKEEKPAENKTQVKALSLKTKLGLDGWQCGSLTQKNTPCTRPIGEEKQDQINSQIELMISLTWSCPELESELDNLVMLVHCHQHDCGNPKDSRIETWITAFPDGDGDAKPVLSVEKQIRKALGRVSTQCIGIKPDHKRCTQRIGGQKVHNCTKTIDEIVKPEVYLDDADLDGFLKVLETNMYCHGHVNRGPLKYVAEWRLDIFQIRKKAASKVVQSIESNAPGWLKSQTRAPGTQETRKISIGNNSNIALRNQELPMPRRSRTFSLKLDQDPVAFWPEAYDTTAFDIIARGDKLADYASSYELVRSEMTKSLGKKDQGNGFVYLYKVEGNSGFVKLGYTGRSLEIRHQEWDFDCNRVVKVLYPIPPGSAIAVPNARRVEALCHAELDYRKIRIYCKGCLKQHIEWFEISPEEAIAVIRKWSKWMNTSPYLSPRLRSGVVWTLKEEEMQKVGNIDRFIKEISLESQ